MLLFLTSFISVHIDSAEYLTLNVNGNPVVIVLSEHPSITYTNNTLHIETKKETIDVHVSQITDMVFSETTGIKDINIQQLQIEKEGNICFQQLPKGSKVNVFTINGIEVLSAIVNDFRNAVINVSNLPKGNYIVKSVKQTFIITNK